MRFLCEKSKDIFREQPMLLEVTAPLVVCGKIEIIQAIFMDNITISLDCLKWVVLLLRRDICS
jgi:hypothetical protein